MCNSKEEDLNILQNVSFYPPVTLLPQTYKDEKKDVARFTDARLFVGL